MHFRHATGVVGLFSHGRSPVVKVLYKLAPLLFEGRLPPPFAPSEPSRPQGRVHAGTKGGHLLHAALARLAAIAATPYPAPRDFPLCRGQNKTSLRLPAASCGTMLSTHSPTALAGEGGADRHQRGRRLKVAFILAPQAPTTTLTAEDRVKL